MQAKKRNLAGILFRSFAVVGSQAREGNSWNCCHNSLDDGGEYGGFRFLGAVQNVGLINALSDHRRM